MELAIMVVRLAAAAVELAKAIVSLLSEARGNDPKDKKKSRKR